MPAFLEEKLRAEYGNNPAAIYGTMNRLGLMKGSKITAKGRAMQAKHDHDAAAARHTGNTIAAVSAARRAGRLRALMGRAQRKTASSYSP